MAVKYVFVTGGVVSGLGKGITAASLGRLLKARGYQVTMQKFDPYINIDPGTMNPIQHGEVFVTDDGTETDLDLGHYERFIDESLDKNSNVTTGKIYWSVLQKERHGDFGGGTVQVIPHITNEIKSRFYRAKSADEDRIAIIEVGGTVGDIESQPFLESIRQFQHDVGQMDIGAKVLPHFIKDTTDRNRTSPFAFTGNKFEFRMLGSAASVANPNIVLNTAVAEVLAEFSASLKDVPEEEMESAVHALLKKTIEEHKRIIFNGNGYTDEWVEEAEKRGLYNLKTTPDALPHFIAEKNIELFTKHGIFTREELFSRYDIWLENYYKTINIESNTLAEMIQKQVIPSVYTYVEKLADTAAAKKSVVADISVASEAALISKLSTLADTMAKDLETLKADTAKALASSDDVLACSKAYQGTVLEDMEVLRKSADEAEALIPDELLPYPTYDELLFSI